MRYIITISPTEVGDAPYAEPVLHREVDALAALDICERVADPAAYALIAKEENVDLLDPIPPADLLQD